VLFKFLNARFEFGLFGLVFGLFALHGLVALFYQVGLLGQLLADTLLPDLLEFLDLLGELRLVLLGLLEVLAVALVVLLEVLLEVLDVLLESL